MSRPTGYIVRPGDMKALQHELNRVRSNTGDLWAAARTLVGFAEPQQTQQTQLPPVSVAPFWLPLNEPVNVPADPDVEPQPCDIPSPEADALDRIAAARWDYRDNSTDGMALFDATWFAATVGDILRETGRL